MRRVKSKYGFYWYIDDDLPPNAIFIWSDGMTNEEKKKKIKKEE